MPEPTGEGIDRVEPSVFDDPAQIRWAVEDLQDWVDTRFMQRDGTAVDTVAVPVGDYRRYQESTALVLRLLSEVTDGPIHPDEYRAEHELRVGLERELEGSESQRLQLSDQLRRLLGMETLAGAWEERAADLETILTDVIGDVERELKDKGAGIADQKGHPIGGIVDTSRVRSALDGGRQRLGQIEKPGAVNPRADEDVASADSE